MNGRGATRERLVGPVLLWTDHLVTADAGVYDRDPVAVSRFQTSGEHVGPAVVSVHGRGGAIGDGVAERHDYRRARGRQHVESVKEEPRGRAVGVGRFAFLRALATRARRGHVGGLEGLGVPRHRPTLAHDMDTDRKLAAGEGCRVWL